MPYKTPYQILAEKRIAESQARSRSEEAILVEITDDIKGHYSRCHIPRLQEGARLAPEDLDDCPYVSRAQYYRARVHPTWLGMTTKSLLRVARCLGTTIDNLYTFDALNPPTGLSIVLPPWSYKPIPPEDKGTLVCRLAEAMDKTRMRPCTLGRMTIPDAKDPFYRAWRGETVNVKLVTAVSIAQALGCKISDLWRLEPSVPPSENVDWL